MKRTIQAGKFKAECLRLMDEVAAKKNSYIITKHNKPIAELIPIEGKKKTLFGCMKGTIQIHDDLIESTGEKWDACS